MTTFAAEVQAHLGAALEAVGFAQTAAPESPAGQQTQVIFCAAFDDIARRFPALPTPDGYRVGEGRCFDFVIEGSLDAGVAEVRAEGCAVDGAVLGSGDLESDLSAVRATIARVFGVTLA